MRKKRVSSTEYETLFEKCYKITIFSNDFINVRRSVLLKVINVVVNLC